MTTPEFNEMLLKHEATPMERVKPYAQNMRYSTKNWSAKFRCPSCGREVWQSLNFLGSRTLVCDGARTRLEARA